MSVAESINDQDSSNGVIPLLPRTLMWNTDGAEFEAVRLEYAQRISNVLGIALARLRTEAPELAGRITACLSRISDESLCRVLLSPNVSYRLLHGSSAVGTGQFLDNCLRIEAFAQENAAESLPPAWGALGDCVVRATGEMIRWDPVDCRLPIDLESPDPIALGSAPPAEATGWTLLAVEEQRTALNALTMAYRRVQSGGASLRALMEICARVVVMRKQHTTWFCSFSSCDFVGRIVLINPQLVNDSLIAQALVHEAIHAYLYMHEPRGLWGLNPDILSEAGVARSPWTGRTLPLCAFLHACFVWYGLFFFWGQEMCSSQLPGEAVQRAIARAGSGFMKGPLLDHLEPGKIGSVREEVRTAVTEMQRNVLSVV